MIKAIETVYKGYKFRSRLEARWAVFFDAMEFEWQYEPEGFDMDGVLYLPDFYLPRVEMWAEVKPGPLNKEETIKAQLLAKYTGKSVLMLVGPPDMKNYWAWEYSDYVHETRDETFTHPTGITVGTFYTCDFLLCHYHNYYIDEKRFYASTGLGENDKFDPEDWMIEDMAIGVLAARQARFEHGQSG